MAPPSELKILSSYLLVPAQLPTIISLQEFTELFPAKLQSSPHIRTLYRDLQSQRNAIVDSVAVDIEDQVQSGRELRRSIARTRRLNEAHEYEEEVEIERLLFGSVPNSKGEKHNILSMIPELEGAINQLQSELQLLGEEEASLQASIEKTVDSMSDLRYGRLANGKLRDDVLEGLTNLQETCKAKN
ncbi:Cnl2/NKP2 family protein-domain-containing protein [Rhypophila decipiens]|uniref:Cnl2/NKP2 family protein-domain-containing protein n=1 Tax=Rhypophila decipiens TaxID=261697 RepID=A0AAN6XVX1_9PEZI|nr:Cnl2/NKP2 family protein-domain-containing protein [Rhypophila decipiens]